ncbi:MAG: hypothetical protein M3Y59_07915 [Myxococcota bacterium]|nr:hypothetical protein [Myxococcota bacterium]
MIAAAVQGPGFFAPLKMIAATVAGAGAMRGGVGMILLGLMLHMIMSVALGVIFAALVPARWSAGVLGAVGGLFGLAVFLVMTWLVLPWANPLMFQNVNLGIFFIAHLVFGVSLGLVVSSGRERTHAGARHQPAERVRV